MRRVSTGVGRSDLSSFITKVFWKNGPQTRRRMESMKRLEGLLGRRRRSTQDAWSVRLRQGQLEYN